MESVRRLTAIMAADVVGYSRLMEADEEGTLARLRSVRAALIESERRAEQGERAGPVTRAVAALPRLLGIHVAR